MRGRSLSLFPCQSPADVFLAVMFYCSREETRIFFFFFFFFLILYGYKGLWHTLDFISSLILEGNVFNYKTKKNTGDLAKSLVVFKVI